MNIIHIMPCVLLGIFLCSTTGKGLGIQFLDKITCLKLQQVEVRLNQLKSYTKQTIPKEAILFTTKRGNTLCADPKMPWVIKAVTALDNKKTKTTKNTKRPTNSRNASGNRKNQKKNNKRAVKKVPKVKPSKATPASIRSAVQS